jgi:hypothetical protein
MKKLLLIFTLLVSTVMFSSPSYAKWTKVSTNTIGVTFYVDFERIRKHDRYVYWWNLNDRLKPSTGGYLSVKIYKQGDCGSFQVKYLSFVNHKEPMGRNLGESYNPKNPQWVYHDPHSANESILKSVCSR